MTETNPRREYLGSRHAIAEALRFAAAALRELGDADLAGEVERTADVVTQRARDDEPTREIALTMPAPPDD